MGTIDQLKDKVFHLNEHAAFSPEEILRIEQLGICFVETEYLSAPKYLGITPKKEASYYIGADWLDEERNVSVMVHPKKKMEELDYFRMFMSCLEMDLAPDYFSKLYCLDLDRKPIPDTSMVDEVTPLMIFHFLRLLQKVVGRGLKRDYRIREENLRYKVKGHIMVPAQVRENILKKHSERNFCRYQEYTLDTPENRLLKKAILFSRCFLNRFHSHDMYGKLCSCVNCLLCQFEGVSENIELFEIRSIQSNRLFKDYNQAISLAKNILKRFSYDIEKTLSNDKLSTPVFWMDMSRLYEVYVYGLLHKVYGENIEFQVPGHYGTAVDFIKLDEGVIIDTKYKVRYATGNSKMIDDIRQISGYARDKKILNHFPREVRRDLMTCLIIYPEKMDEEDEEVEAFDPQSILSSSSKPVKGFEEFYKIAVKLPVKK